MKNMWLAGFLAVTLAACLFDRTEDKHDEDDGPVRGDVPLVLTFNVTPDPAWEPGADVTMAADARRSPDLNQEDIFASRRYPGPSPRVAGQRQSLTLTDVRVGEKILVQGYICSDQSSDCYPSDSDNPPSCAAEVHILGGLRASCQPAFTWTGGQGNGGVLCRAECL